MASKRRAGEGVVAMWQQSSVAWTGDICYWELVDAVLVKRFKAHPGVVCSLALHPDGTSLLTSSVDGTIKVWSSEETTD
jgi:WD40 repeat protein